MSALTVSAAPLLSAVAAGYELGVGRTVPTFAALLGLIGVIAGAIAVARSRRPGAGRAWLVTALVLGPVGVLVGGLHGANAAGGPGTGNGVVGALFAVVLGSIATVLGALALARSRRTGPVPR
ncbi:DUF6223 family protein [Nocardia wallacei]|uniref:DUF6223 family protein n=1 Tax=Nocardia wallacei TaxID=480035 RepID=UPI0024565275|nr:DUF6223 family protein [Nocardia wallacei]